VMTKKTTTLAVAIAAMATIGVTTAVSAIGDGPQSRAQASQDASLQFAAFDRPQVPGDVFRPHGSNESNRAAATEIAKTSRSVISTPEGDGHAFLNARNEVCFLWRPSTGGVGTSGCGRADRSPVPGILFFRMEKVGDKVGDATVAGLLPKGATNVRVTRADGRAVDVATTPDGAYAYSGEAPFSFSWTSADGELHNRDVPTLTPPDQSVASR